MPSFVLSRAADSDIRKIANYSLEKWGRSQRNTYITELFDAFEHLAESPQIAIKIDQIRAGYRKFPQGSHVIFFKESSQNQIEIVRVLHKSMDVSTQIGSF